MGWSENLHQEKAMGVFDHEKYGGVPFNFALNLSNDKND